MRKRSAGLWGLFIPSKGTGFPSKLHFRFASGFWLEKVGDGLGREFLAIAPPTSQPTAWSKECVASGQLTNS